jgi:hypothetical protein
MRAGVFHHRPAGILLMAKGQNTSSAVMAQRAPAQVEADDDLQRLYRKLDFYPTAPWAARAGAEIVKFIDPTARVISEPACGMGHMSIPLREFFREVRATDVYPYWQQGVPHDHRMAGRDYLGGVEKDEVDWMITNPPFAYAADFVRQGLLQARRGVAVLCRLAFLESADRYPLHFRCEHPLSHVVYFVERVPMTLGRWDPNASTATAYAWFIYDKEYTKLRGPELMAIPPGTKARLSKPSDIRDFANKEPAPLFEGAQG